MTKQEIAVGMIESRFDALRRSSSDVLHAEISMAVEMAYALGAIDLNLHRHYVERRNKFIELDHQKTMEKLGVKA